MSGSEATKRLDGPGLGESRRFADLDSEAFPSFEAGDVWLVGAGPGAPGLLTVMGYYALCHADVVVYDALVGSGILRWARPGAELVYAGKRGGKPSAKQTDISLTLVDYAKAGKRVLRLKGGDPFIFGRGGEECQTLADHDVRFRIVPGISSGIGGLAYAGIPATHRDTNHSVTFLTGHDSSGTVPQSVDWAAVATASPVIVMYMAVKNMAEIADKLMAGGRSSDDAVAIVSQATMPDQDIVITSLGEAGALADHGGLKTPAVVVIGDVVNVREKLEWYHAELRQNELG